MRSGALNEYVKLEPMSDFKWRQLLGLIACRRVADVAGNGVRNHQYDENVDIPAMFTETLCNCAQTHREMVRYPAELSNKFRNKKYIKLREDALDDSKVTIETVHLIDVLVYNIHQTLNTGISFPGLLEMGRTLRKPGNKIDYDKIDYFLNELHLGRIAQLEGCFLIVAFGFKPEEIPFVKEMEPKASDMLLESLHKGANAQAVSWNFSEGRTGFVRDNNKALRKNLNHGLQFFRFAPSETISNFLGKLAKGLSEIEE